MDANCKAKIEYELSEIDDLISKSLPVVDVCKSKVPEFMELCAVGSILHSFYNGLENIFVLFAKSQSFCIENDKG